MPCEKREGLAKIFLDAAVEVERNEELLRSECGRQVALRVGKACEEAQANLNAHRERHGCDDVDRVTILEILDSANTQEGRTSAVARTEALRNESRRLCLQALHRQRESAELRIACQKAGQECRLSIERSKVRRGLVTTHEPVANPLEKLYTPICRIDLTEFYLTLQTY